MIRAATASAAAFAALTLVLGAPAQAEPAGPVPPTDSQALGRSLLKELVAWLRGNMNAFKVTHQGKTRPLLEWAKQASDSAVAESSGPFPVVWYQHADQGTYDAGVFSVPWLETVSVAKPPAPPGQWADVNSWEWGPGVCIIGPGLDGCHQRFPGANRRGNFDFLQRDNFLQRY